MSTVDSPSQPQTTEPGPQAPGTAAGEGTPSPAQGASAPLRPAFDGPAGPAQGDQNAAGQELPAVNGRGASTLAQQPVPAAPLDYADVPMGPVGAPYGMPGLPPRGVEPRAPAIRDLDPCASLIVEIERLSAKLRAQADKDMLTIQQLQGRILDLQRDNIYLGKRRDAWKGAVKGQEANAEFWRLRAGGKMKQRTISKSRLVQLWDNCANHADFARSLCAELGATVTEE